MIPNKIYLTQYDNGDSVRNTWSGEMFFCDDVEFIRKDILLEWAKEEQAKCSSETHPYAMFMNVVIDKLNSL